MLTWLIFLAVLLIVLRYRFPYFLKDLQYGVQTTLVGYRLAKYAQSNPYFTLLDRFLETVSCHPQKTFISFKDENFSYQETDRQSNRIARALREHAGVRQGDTVALLLGNEPVFLWTWLGLTKLGCSAALLNYNLRSRSLLHCFSCCGAKVLLAAAELRDAVEEVLPVLTEQGVTVFLFTEVCETVGMETLSDKISLASDTPLPSDLRANVTFSSPAVYIYTSGTTGLPKAAVISHQRLWTMSSLQSIVGVCSDDVVYVNLPLYHTAGFALGFTGAIERGASLVLRNKFSASQFWDDCRKYNVTVMQYIGETMRYLCNTPKSPIDPVHNVRIAFGNGLRADVWRDFLQRFGHVEIRELYAATEGNMSFINYAGKIGAVGRVNPLHKRLFPFAVIQYDLEKEEPVRNAEGLCIEAPRGETGLMVARITQKAPFSGYARDLKQTERKKLHDVLEKGDVYFNSGDLLMVDHDNFLYFQDRVGDTFRWKGENVATNEISDILTMMSSITEANVYGVKVPGHEGRVGMAAVTLQNGEAFDGSRVFSHVCAYLPAYARPRFIRIQSALEVTGTFKQMKVKLVEEGFSPDAVRDPIHFLDEREKRYSPLTADMHAAILQGSVKL
ncbi:very long-chain acyl-CoA synthetase-like [Alosa alosa]|uniref:very long-chain acyl-CoA synthetase-like n=1 Tax=Alosa alosa TaxID=278164 RepID=UPI002015235F|nr:very long-chain acyl-CoA synthetase-like [Alosa alosa]